MLAKGDKLVATKCVANVLNEGDIVDVINVNENGMISFSFCNGMHMGVMNAAECEEYFVKVAPKTEAPKVSFERVDWIMSNSEIEVNTVFNKCTIVSCKLPNGFVIVESSSCVSPENYSEDIGVDICLDKIRDKIWELEGYVLQEDLYLENIDECDCCLCNECEFEDCNKDCDDEYDDCNEDEFNCDECDEYDCPSNPKHYS